MSQTHSMLRILMPIMALAALNGCAGTPARTPVAAAPIAVPTIARPQGETPAWWYRAGASQALEAAREAGGSQAKARNLIVFLGDGMSLPTVAAARILAGQRAGGDGESHRLAFERFPFTALSRTYETNQQTPDSAGTMSAITTGVKTRAGFIAIDQVPRRGDCAAARGHERVTLLELGRGAGMAVGVVTTARLTHATPAATYAHISERNWEGDADMPPEVRRAGCRDIAAQLADFPGGLDVAMGGGRSRFMHVGTPDPEYPDRVGLRLDGRDLIGEWKKRHPHGHYVWNARQLAAVDTGDGGPLLGLFEPSHMQYEADRLLDGAGEPSLATMTRAAIAVLKARSHGRGFVLVVEGGRIDHALHAGNAYRALDETLAMDEAVRAARDLTDPADTLIVVTADHSHTLSFAGYPVRGNPILGLVHGVTDSYQRGHGTQLARDKLGRPYTTLGFANGPGYSGASDRQPEGAKTFPHRFDTVHGIGNGRPDLAGIDTTDPDFMQEAVYPLKSETHGGEDVAVYALGPGARAFHGEVEQNVIYHVIVQHVAALGQALCALGACNDEGIPVRLPVYADWLRAVPREPSRQE